MSDSIPPGFVLENRDHLINILAEAAEIEHNLMCCYLYAAFSLKQGTDEDLSERELAAVQGWRRSIVSIAVEEMTHLALVANVTVALGGTPHFSRPNFPVPGGYHPAGLVVRLAPFDHATLEHFIFLERPDEAQVHDGAGFEPERRYVRTATPGRLMPTSSDYETVGGFYRAIRQGLERLAKVDPAALFIGRPEQQLGPEVGLPGLVRVTDLATALEALDEIVVQGEGAAGHAEDSHYQRFLAIQRELVALCEERPSFVPARPAAQNPLMRRPTSFEGRVWVELEPAAGLLDLCNAAYIDMLRLLTQAYAETRGAAAQRAHVEASVALMSVISPLASELTRLPASPHHPGCHAGMSFAMVRATAALAPCAASDAILRERLSDIAHTAAAIAAPFDAPAKLARIAARFSSSVAQLALSTEPPPAPLSAPPGPVAAAPIPVSTLIDGVEVVEGKSLTLLYEGKRCIHARHCVLGQPGVFKANVQGPWLDPDAAHVEGLVVVAHQCPSGAIRYRRKDGGPEEPTPPVNLLQLRENGPLGLRGDLRIDGQSSGFRATLCRCGASQRKPFCDGSHVGIGFAASGEPETRASEPLAARGGALEITPLLHGPLQVNGNLELCAGTGRTLNRVTSARLCRCGGSANKPYCDGTHQRIGFRSQ